MGHEESFEVFFRRLLRVKADRIPGYIVGGEIVVNIQLTLVSAN